MQGYFMLETFLMSPNHLFAFQGRKGVHEPVSFKNESAIPEFLYFKQHNRVTRSDGTTKRSGKTVRHSPHEDVHYRRHHGHHKHHRLNSTEQDQQQNDTTAETKEKKSSYPAWIQKIVKAFHLPPPASDSDARKTWFTLGENKPFVAGKYFLAVSYDIE